MSLHFIRPDWLWALLPLAGLLFALYKTQGASTAWSKYIAPHLAHLLVDSGKKESNSSIVYIAIIWLLSVIALSGPAVTKQNLPVFASTQGRVIVMDMSLSMYATDLVPNRLSQARYKATDLIKSLKEGETGLIAYAGDAFTISPLTRDKATLLNLLPNLSPSIMPVAGSNIVAALTKAKELLTQGGHIKGDIILFADGIKASQLSDAKDVLSGTDYRLAIMTFGTPQGAAVRLPNGDLLRDNADQVVVAKTDFHVLSELASNFHGIVTRNQADDSDTQDVENWLSTDDSAKLTDLQGEAWQDLGPYVALLILPLLLLSFRKQFSVALLLVGLGLSQPNTAYAMDWDSLWKTQNQRAQQNYDNKDYQQAAKQFDDPQWKASAQYKAGNYQDALSGFEQDKSANGLYNQGNSLMHMNNFSEAEKRYQQALKQDPNFTDAKQNLELAKKLQKQQQQNQSKSDKNNQDKDQKSKKKDQKDQNKDSQQQQNKNQQNKQNQQQNQQNQKSSEQQKSDSQNKQQENQKPNEKQSPEQKKQQQKTKKEQERQQAEAQKRKQSKQEQNKGKSPIEKIDPNKPKDLPPEMQRQLKAIPEDPQLLLRNKMQLEYQKRRQQGRLPKESEQW
ncbi:VWA domain-containing protein [Shewanella sp. 202IG2-18]|uniref:VWA domain-containing protein n=1 Tax=Parashewanella hymeniacidonis TaxID=2807618 RepID=UPI001960B461|nr:VWA domain-containing protein [Parashewanella hymeniacidonis]MBM7073096.1 VWA domain-containing protein [Parashewanella hymeniacidonis]